MNKNNLRELIDKKTHIIFDFDGVLVDSVNIKTDAFYNLYSEYGEEIANKVVEYHLNNGGMSRYDKFKYYHHTYLNRSITALEMELLDNRFSNYVVDSVVKAPEIPGAESFLEQVYLNNNCTICSATPQKEIREIVNLRGWDKYFISIYGSPELKRDNVIKALNETHSKNYETIYFGDAHADYLAAKEYGIDFIGVGKLWQMPDNTYDIEGVICDFICLVE
jgi:phosphoglycolate phosphatase-like HAD superfamily hydrolase